MNATRPEAETEYSRGQPASARAISGADRIGRPRRPQRVLELAVLAGGWLGAVLLLVAEFTPLLQRPLERQPRRDQHRLDRLAQLLRAASRSPCWRRCSRYGVWRTRSRLALLAIGAARRAGRC